MDFCMEFVQYEVFWIIYWNSVMSWWPHYILDICCVIYQLFLPALYVVSLDYFFHLCSIGSDLFVYNMMYLLFSDIIRQLVLPNMYECVVLHYLKGFSRSACILGSFLISFSLSCQSAHCLQFPPHVSSDSVTEGLQDNLSSCMFCISLLLADVALQRSNCLLR